MQRIQDRLRRTREHNMGFGGTWVLPVNPNGPEAADYIDNAMTHMGYILKIAFENIEDYDTREELRRRAYAAWEGVK